MKKKKIAKVIEVILMLLSITFIVYPTWEIGAIGKTTFEQLIFNIFTNATKGNLDILWQFVRETFIFYILLGLLIGSILFAIEKYFKKIKWARTFAIGIIFLSSFIYGLYGIGFFDYMFSSLEKTTIYEEEYKDPNEVELTFPEKKRNLIYIVMESMDRNIDKYKLENGEIVNLIPNLSNLEKENIYFYDEESSNGMNSVTNTTWTAASLVGQVTGVPLSDIYEANQVMQKGNFLPGITSLGEILESQGYKNYFIMGSDASFGSRDVFFEDHGNYEIHDLRYQKEIGKLPKDYMVFWGYEDSKLFEFAKEELTEIAKNEEPFNYTMLTVNTHFMEGHVDDENPEKYGGYRDAYYYSDKEISEFIEWIKKQDFYENTTIVLVGDHKTMNADFLENQDQTVDLYHVFINSAAKPVNTAKDSIILDMFPSTLASLGVKIEGDRLGLGTNLFSDKNSLIDKYGIDELNEELKKKSIYYEDNFIK